MNIDAEAALVGAAIAASFLSQVEEASKTRLLETSRMVRAPAGRVLVDGLRDFGGIVVGGLLRVFADDGSGGPTLTYRNLGSGDALGLGALLGVRDEISVQTVTSSEVLSLDLAVLGQIRSRDPSVALALAREVMRRSDDTARELRVQVRGSVRDRTVRHLLDLAATVSGGDPSMIEVSHERLAEAIGSRREVVSRALSLLERQGLIQLERGRVSILDPSGLKSALEGV